MNANADNAKMEIARFNMIEQQIRTWDVLDPTVLQLLNDVPREQFVPANYQGLAFADLEIPMGRGHVMLSPKLEGRMLQALSVQPTDHVLHIGTGTGYLTALIAKLAKSVVSVDIEPSFSALAAQHLQKHHIHNVILEVGDASRGWETHAPYDVIVFGASSPVEPVQLRQQLAVNGRMLIVLGTAPAMRATLIQRISEHGYKEDVLFETCIAPLINAAQAQPFHF